MKIFYLLSFICSLSLAAEAISIPKFPKAGSKAKFVPVDWEILGEASGDLNKDNKDDIVLVLRYKAEETSDESPRILLVLFQTKPDLFALSHQSSKAILQKTEGGVMGDPFQEVKIDRGSILLNHYGGSSTRWGYSHRFQFRNKDFLLIGQTITNHDSHKDEIIEVDTNLITGKEVRTKTVGQRKPTVRTKSNPKKPLERLKDFDPRNIN
jgi:hypothetical protein